MKRIKCCNSYQPQCTFKLTPLKSHWGIKYSKVPTLNPDTLFILKGILLLADLSHLSEFTQLDAYPPKVALRARSEIILKLGHGTQQ